MILFITYVAKTYLFCFSFSFFFFRLATMVKTFFRENIAGKDVSHFILLDEKSFTVDKSVLHIFYRENVELGILVFRGNTASIFTCKIDYQTCS